MANIRTESNKLEKTHTEQAQEKVREAMTVKDRIEEGLVSKEENPQEVLVKLIQARNVAELKWQESQKANESVWTNFLKTQGEGTVDTIEEMVEKTREELNFVKQSVLDFTKCPITSYQIRLTNLHCYHTEDSGEDEVELHIRSDIEGTQKLSEDMDGGENWPLNKVVGFKSIVELELWERDTGFFDDDDHLGTVSVGPTNLQGCAVFEEDEAHYEICWLSVSTNYEQACKDIKRQESEEIENALELKLKEAEVVKQKTEEAEFDNASFTELKEQVGLLETAQMILDKEEMHQGSRPGVVLGIVFAVGAGILGGVYLYKNVAGSIPTKPEDMEVYETAFHKEAMEAETPQPSAPPAELAGEVAGAEQADASLVE